MSQHLYLVKDDKGNTITFGAESAGKAARMHDRVFKMTNAKVTEVIDQGPAPQRKIIKINGPDFHPVLPVEAKPRPKPNDSCPCGSGRKWKKCCMRKPA